MQVNLSQNEGEKSSGGLFFGGRWVHFIPAPKFKAKSGVDLQFKRVKASTGTSVTDGADSVLVAVDTTSNVIQTITENDARYALKTITITGGAGLSNGGDLSQNRTLNIQATDGVRTLNDSIRIQLATNSSLQIVSGASAVDSLKLSLPTIYNVTDISAGYFNPQAGDLTGATMLASDDDNTNDFSIDQLEFSATAENYISAVISMPPDWDASTAPKFKIIYYSGIGHASNTVEWDIAIGYVRPGTDSWIAALGSGVSTNHNPTTANVWYITDALSPTPAGTAAAGAQIKIRIFRDGDDATNDTHTATARLVKVLMQYTKTIYGNETSW